MGKQLKVLVVSRTNLGAFTKPHGTSPSLRLRGRMCEQAVSVSSVSSRIASPPAAAGDMTTAAAPQVGVGEKLGCGGRVC